MDRTRALGTAMGIVRAGVGGVLATSPGWAGRIWLGDAVDTPVGRVLARSVGARDATIGVATLAALGRRQPTAQLLTLGFANGLADAAATMLAARHLDARRRYAMPAVAAGVAAAGIIATMWARAADEAGSDGSGGSSGAADEVEAPVELPVGAGGDGSTATSERTPGAPFFA
jgi:hypothetical protein